MGLVHHGVVAHRHVGHVRVARAIRLHRDISRPSHWRDICLFGLLFLRQLFGLFGRRPVVVVKQLVALVRLVELFLGCLALFFLFVFLTFFRW